MRLRFDSTQFHIERATLVIARFGGNWSLLDVAVESDLSADFDPPGPGEYIVMLDEVEAADRRGGTEVEVRAGEDHVVVFRASM